MSLLEEYLAARDALIQAERAVKTTLQQMIDACPHTNVIEGDYEARPLGTSPPFRVCVDCGYAEEGWHCGYFKLQKPFHLDVVSFVPRSTAYQHVRQFHTQLELDEIRFLPRGAKS